MANPLRDSAIALCADFLTVEYLHTLYVGGDKGLRAFLGAAVRRRLGGPRRSSPTALLRRHFEAQKAPVLVLASSGEFRAITRVRGDLFRREHSRWVFRTVEGASGTPPPRDRNVVRKRKLTTFHLAHRSRRRVLKWYER